MGCSPTSGGVDAPWSGCGPPFGTAACLVMCVPKRLRLDHLLHCTDGQVQYLACKAWLWWLLQPRRRITQHPYLIGLRRRPCQLHAAAPGWLVQFPHYGGDGNKTKQMARRDDAAAWRFRCFSSRLTRATTHGRRAHVNLMEDWHTYSIDGCCHLQDQQQLIGAIDVPAGTFARCRLPDMMDVQRMQRIALLLCPIHHAMVLLYSSGPQAVSARGLEPDPRAAANLESSHCFLGQTNKVG